MSSSNCCFLTCIQISQEAGQMVWYSHLFHNFLQFIVIHTVKGFGIVNKAEIDVFWSSLAFLMIQQMLAIWSLVPLPFLKPAWTSGSSQFTYCSSLAWRIWALLCYHVFSWVHFCHSAMSNSLRPHEPQHSRPLCPSPTPKVYPNSCPLSRWCHPTMSSSVVPFSSGPQSFPASGSFQMSQLFASGGQITGVSASALVLPMNTQDWSP